MFFTIRNTVQIFLDPPTHPQSASKKYWKYIPTEPFSLYVHMRITHTNTHIHTHTRTHAHTRTHRGIVQCVTASTRTLTSIRDRIALVDRSTVATEVYASGSVRKVANWSDGTFDIFSTREGWPTHPDPHLFQIVKNIGNSGRPLIRLPPPW